MNVLLHRRDAHAAQRLDGQVRCSPVMLTLAELCGSAAVPPLVPEAAPPEFVRLVLPDVPDAPLDVSLPVPPDVPLPGVVPDAPPDVLLDSKSKGPRMEVHDIKEGMQQRPQPTFPDMGLIEAFTTRLRGE